MLERIDADDDKAWMRGDANALQSVAVARWFGGRDDDAGKSLAEAEEAAGRHEISCWSYTRVPRKTFLGHCAEIRRLFDGRGRHTGVHADLRTLGRARLMMRAGEVLDPLRGGRTAACNGR